MKSLGILAMAALAGLGAGALLFRRPAPPPHPLFPPAPASSSQLPVAHAYVPKVPLMAVIQNRSASPDGSDVLESTYMVAVRRDGSRAIVYPLPPNGWLQWRVVYDPATQTHVDIYDNLGIKLTWQPLQTDPMSVITSGCTPLPGSKSINVLGYEAVQDSHHENTAGTTTFDTWRIPELGCLQARRTIQFREKDGANTHNVEIPRELRRDGSYARNAESRLIWLSLTDPPEGLFDVSDGLEEVTKAVADERIASLSKRRIAQPVVLERNGAR